MLAAGSVGHDSEAVLVDHHVEVVDGSAALVTEFELEQELLLLCAVVDGRIHLQSALLLLSTRR